MIGSPDEGTFCPFWIHREFESYWTSLTGSAAPFSSFFLRPTLLRFLSLFKNFLGRPLQISDLQSCSCRHDASSLRSNHPLPPAYAPGSISCILSIYHDWIVFSIVPVLVCLFQVYCGKLNDNVYFHDRSL
jgi:hypothetical protein